MCIFRFQLQLDEVLLDTWVARRAVTAEMDTQVKDRTLSSSWKLFSVCHWQHSTQPHSAGQQLKLCLYEAEL